MSDFWGDDRKGKPQAISVPSTGTEMLRDDSFGDVLFNQWTPHLQTRFLRNGGIAAATAFDPALNNGTAVGVWTSFGGIEFVMPFDGRVGYMWSSVAGFGGLASNAYWVRLIIHPGGYAPSVRYGAMAFAQYTPFSIVGVDPFEKKKGDLVIMSCEYYIDTVGGNLYVGPSIGPSQPITVYCIPKLSYGDDIIPKVLVN